MCLTHCLYVLARQELAKQALASLPQVAPEVVKEVLAEDDDQNYHMPAVDQMLPYKPQLNVRKCQRHAFAYKFALFHANVYNNH